VTIIKMVHREKIQMSEVAIVYISSVYRLLYFSITRTFASGKTEKIIMQCLKDLGFASGKVRTSFF